MRGSGDNELTLFRPARGRTGHRKVTTEIPEEDKGRILSLVNRFVVSRPTLVGMACGNNFLGPMS